MKRVVTFKSQLASILLSLVAVLLVSSCDRRDLEVMASEKTNIRLDFDWMTRFGTRPTGMTVMLWSEGSKTPR